MFVFDNDKRPRLVAANLKKLLAAAGIECSMSRSLQLSSRIFEFPHWNALLKPIGVEPPSPFDEALSSDKERGRRKMAQIAALVNEGVPFNLALEIIDKLKPTASPDRIPEAAFDAEDAEASQRRTKPAWATAEDEKGFNFGDIADLGPFVGYTPEMDEPIAQNDEDFRMPDGRIDREAKWEAEKAEIVAMSNGGAYLDENGDIKITPLTPQEIEQSTRAKNEFDERLLGLGAAHVWSVHSIRATRKGSSGKWQAAAGSVIAEVILPNNMGDTEEHIPFALSQVGLIDSMDTFSFWGLVTEKGYAVVERESREPRFILRKKHVGPAPR